jgi:hypothetical protein
VDVGDNIMERPIFAAKAHHVSVSPGPPEGSNEQSGAGLFNAVADPGNGAGGGEKLMVKTDFKPNRLGVNAISDTMEERFCMGITPGADV